MSVADSARLPVAMSAALVELGAPARAAAQAPLPAANWLPLAAVVLAGLLLLSLLLRGLLARQRARAQRQLQEAVATAKAEAGRALQQQRASEARLLRSMSGAGFAAWSVDLETGASWRSLQYDRLFGYTTPMPDWTLRMFLDHVLAEDRPAVEELLARSRAPGGGGLMQVTFECRIRRADGAIRWIEARGMRESEGNSASIIFGLIHDITDRKQSDMELGESRRRVVEKERRLAEAQQIAQIGSWDIEFATRRLSVSDELCRIFGLQSGMSLGTMDDFLARVHPDDRDATARAIETTAESGAAFFVEHRIIQPSGEVRLIEAQGRPITGPDGVAVGIAGTVHDITERQAAEEHLHRLAHYDYLTALPNRKLFYETLAREVEVGRGQDWSLALLYLDLDRFKDINDTFGHATGDELLRKVAERILSCTRVRDTVGRLGGDEFGLIALTASGADDLTNMAEKLIEEFRRPFLLGSHEVTVNASIGIALCPADAADTDSLTKCADLAMYHAKAEGRNAFRFYTPGMNDRAREKLQMERALRQAIDRGEFELYYQPEIDIESGEWTGAEALLRWNRPGHGVVMPEQFVPALEETGLIVPVGRWVIDTACRQLGQWRGAGMGAISLSVNVSARQLRPPAPRPGGRDIGDGGWRLDEIEGICELVERCSRLHRVVPGTLQLELTETALMAQPEVVAELLARLKKSGVRILVDDFGTGYSSLAYLKRFPIDTLKIDREFVSDLSGDPDDRAITRTIIRLAHSLKLKVIAEGVETRAQLDFLQDEHCDQAQGFYIARPMPAADLQTLFLGNGAGLGHDFERRQASLFDRGIVSGRGTVH